MILRTCSKGGFDGNDEVGFSLDSSCGTLPGETLGDSIGSDGCDGDGLFATKGVNNPLDPAGRYPFPACRLSKPSRSARVDRRQQVS